MYFFDRAGKMAIGSRLRMLTDKIMEDATQIYKLYEINLKAKWFPVFYILTEDGSRTITSMAKDIGHSHPSVSNIIREMAAEGLVVEKKDQNDGRRNIIELSKKGKQTAEKITDQYKDVTAAINSIIHQTRYDLWKAVEEWEFLLSEKPLLERVKEEKKTRESIDVEIVAYKEEYKEVFKKFNSEWIENFFEMEDADYKALDNPKEYILDKGGYIFVALYKNEPAGVCALIRMDDINYDFELAKMAVSPKYQKKNIGFLLCQAAIYKARETEATNIYIESNTILKPTINLYQKLGFKKIAGHPTPYKRCNIQMELNLNK